MLAVTFDCWGTLIVDRGYAAARHTRVRALVEISHWRLDDEGAEDLLRRAVGTHHAAWMRGVQYGAEGIARLCGDELSLTDARTGELREALEEASRHGAVEALPGAADVLEGLRTAGMRTALVCDAGLTPGRIVRDYLDELGLLDHLEHCAFSNEVGVPKPNAAIFHDALRALDVPPETGVHVGDLLRTDIHGARSLGMRTVRITAENDDATQAFSWEARDGDGPPYPDADEVVASHDELSRALGRLGVPPRPD